MNEYRTRHEALYELMPPPVDNDGMRFTHKLTQEEATKIKPYTLMLESLLDNMIILLADNTANLQACLTQYSNSMERYFGKALLTFDVNPHLAS